MYKDAKENKGALETLLTEPDNNEEIFKVLTNLNNIQIYNVTFATPVSVPLMQKIIKICLNYKIDLILIIGDIEFTDRDLVNEVVEVVTDCKNLSGNVVNGIKKISKILEDVSGYEAKCGMRNETLIINLSGPHRNKKQCLKAILENLIILMLSIHDMKNSIVRKNDTSSENKENTKPKELEGSSSTSEEELFEEDDDNSNNDNMVFPIISLHIAMSLLQEITKKGSKEREPEIIKVTNACGRILFEDIDSNLNVPSCRTSTKHGYAVIAAEGEGLRKVLNDVKDTLSVISLEPGTCIWVNSGAPIPNKATAIIPEQYTNPVEKLGDKENTYIEIKIKPQHGQNIKPIGYDIRRGNTVINKYTLIGPEEIGILTSIGRRSVVVSSRLSIGILSIGNNLEEPGNPLKPGYVYDINRITLISLLKRNYLRPIDFGIVDNKFLSIRNKIEKALKTVEVIVTIGSASDKDLLKKILIKDFNATIHFGNVNMKPGKSTTLATCKINGKTQYFFCLPGNPTSAFIAAHMFLLPFLNRLCSLTIDAAIIPAQVDVPYMLHSRPRLSWVSLKWSNTGTVAHSISSGNLIADKLNNIVGSNALVLLPEKTEEQHVLTKQTLPILMINNPTRTFGNLSSITFPI
ncbi:gephyrin-like [Pogonomyrmex barbatus]|uniref:molybdopterin adenylyltransferase n=1 Tax=Pogonomyrmex barbatus TaxID=144034 RepID=A0A6I9WU15_9HYME|nr:gephyrin-like [Pogonomyrmex barbatus]